MNALPWCFFVLMLFDPTVLCAQSGVGSLHTLDPPIHYTRPDIAGNIYFLGRALEQEDAADTTNSSLQTIARQGSYLQKIGPAGDTLWTRFFWGTPATEMKSVKTDSKGQVFVSGSFRNRLDVGTENLPDVRHASDCAWGDLFILKFSAAGETEWLYQVPNTGNVRLNVAFEYDGRIRAIGTLYDAMDFDPGPTQMIVEPVDRPDAIKLFLAPSGKILEAHTLKEWARKNGSPTYQVIEPK